MGNAKNLINAAAFNRINTICGYEVVVLLNQPTAFLTFLLPSPSPLLTPPIVEKRKKRTCIAFTRTSCSLMSRGLWCFQRTRLWNFSTLNVFDTKEANKHEKKN